MTEIKMEQEELTRKEAKKSSRIKATAKFLFNIPAWIGTDTIRENTNWLGELIRNVFTLKHKSEEASSDFSEVAARFGISEAELHQQSKNFLFASFIFLALGIIFIIYTAYLYFHSSFLIILGSCIVSGLFLLRSYFYSLWYLQIKKRQLGCSFRTWLSWLFRGKI